MTDDSATSLTTGHLHFVTGKLAESALRRTLQDLEPQLNSDYSVGVLPITVAALMTMDWVSRKISPPEQTKTIVLPGYCLGEASSLAAALGINVVVGPKDLRDLPSFFGKTSAEEYGDYRIEIIAEINHAPRLPINEIVAEAKQLSADGADVIDVGCIPGNRWRDVGNCVAALRSEGLRVSIDSFDIKEIATACDAGAELVLSVNRTNREAASDWGCEVVVIPDDFATLGGLQETVEFLANENVAMRLDPILEPIGFGFAQSLERYLRVRDMFPDAAMMMGIGNITELTDVDSAGVNTLLLAICEELRISSVLTTQVIHWAKSSVAECNVARRLVHHALKNGVPPKHLEDKLIMLRDANWRPSSEAEIDELAAQVRDNNFRIAIAEGKIHLFNGDIHIRGNDPFLMMEELLATKPANMDPTHAFYIGFELSKAATAVTLGKNYVQDQALNWGILTQQEQHHRLRPKLRRDT
jgi:dihydropteroate synthase-like protein